ncbi:MAG TPA: hypothetical protein ENN79_13660 [Desulfobacteraceae bacterium]|nr:hypothetical protein [Desulfobacteraceae bacterium]
MTSHWQYSTVHNSACKVIEEQTLWGQTVCRVWLPLRELLHEYDYAVSGDSSRERFLEKAKAVYRRDEGGV